MPYKDPQKRREYNRTYNRAYMQVRRAIPEFRARELEAGKRYRNKYPERVLRNARRNDLRRKYGITLEQYDTLLMAQNGKCALCKKPPSGKHLAVDHDHKTGGIRGLLCWMCNQSLGIVEKRFTMLGLHFYLNRPQMKGGRT